MPREKSTSFFQKIAIPPLLVLHEILQSYHQNSTEPEYLLALLYLAMFRLRTQLKDLVPELNHQASVLSEGSQAPSNSNIRDSLILQPPPLRKSPFCYGKSPLFNLVSHNNPLPCEFI